LGAVVARALSERVTVETDGRVKRFTKLEATVRAIVDGATKGDARAIKRKRPLDATFTAQG
jgi:hypothetical protein